MKVKLIDAINHRGGLSAAFERADLPVADMLRMRRIMRTYNEAAGDFDAVMKRHKGRVSGKEAEALAATEIDLPFEKPFVAAEHFRDGKVTAAEFDALVMLGLAVDPDAPKAEKEPARKKRADVASE